MGRDEQDTLSGAYVLNAITDAERAAFARRLEASEAMLSEVTELADTAVALGLAVPPVAPPPRLKASLLEAIATIPQLAPFPREDAAVDQISEPRTPSTTAEERAQRRWLFRPAGLLAVAAVAVLLLLAGGVVGRFLGTESPADQQAAAFAQLTAAPDVASVPTTLPGGGAGRLLVSPSLGRSALVWTGELPSAGKGRVYELWYMGTGTRAAGLVDPSAPGPRFRVLDGTLHEGDLVGMTVEAAGGAAQPTADAVLVVDPASAS